MTIDFDPYPARSQPTDLPSWRMWQSNSLSAPAGIVSRKVVLTLSLAARTRSSAGCTKPSLTGATFGVLKRKAGLDSDFFGAATNRCGPYSRLQCIGVLPVRLTLT